MSRSLIYRGRSLTLAMLGDWSATTSPAPFVALVPASNESERQQVEASTGALVDAGCVEICCVGCDAEVLHDAIDWIVEERGALEVVTTWDVDEREGCEYFLQTAAGASLPLLALILEHPALTAQIERIVASLT
jgi:hypothetical protein